MPTTLVKKKGKGVKGKKGSKGKTGKQPPPAVKFAPVDGSQFTQHDADVIGPELYKLARQHNGISTREILREATNAASPLHGYFEWDDKKAAARHRLAQAAKMARSIEVVWTTPTGGEHRTRAMYFVVTLLSTGKPQAAVAEPDDDAPDLTVTRPKKAPAVRKAFVRFDDVTDNPGYAKQVIDNATAEFQAVRAKYQFALTMPQFKKKFAAVWAAIHAL